jgi:hypothetical protein
MAAHLHEEFGFPTIVKHDQTLESCGPVSEASAGTFVSMRPTVTQFIYGRRAVCIVVFMLAEGAQSDTPLVKFDANSGNVLGSLVSGEYREWRRLGFRFPAGPPPTLDESVLRDFFDKVPRALNLRQPGALASAIHELESDQAGGNFAKTTADKAGVKINPVSGAGEGDKAEAEKASSLYTGRNLIAIIALSTVIIVTIQIVFFALRRRQNRPPADPSLKQVKEKPAAAPPPRKTSAQSAPGERPARMPLAFKVANDLDKSRMASIESKLHEFTARHMQESDVQRIVKTAQSVYALAAKSGLPDPLAIVDEYMKWEGQKADGIPPDDVELLKQYLPSLAAKVKPGLAPLPKSAAKTEEEPPASPLVGARPRIIRARGE